MNLDATTYEGPLERKITKWKEYHVVLRGGQLFFYKDKSSINTGLLGTLELSVTTFCNSSSGVLSRGYQFSVSTPAIEAHLRASTAEQRDRWIKEIMSAVTELNTYKRTMAMPSHGGSVRSVQPQPQESQVYDSTLVVHVGTPEHEWYWPGKTREQAEQMLRNVDHSHFLVRDSGHEQGSYSLSVRVGSVDQNIFHYIIKRDQQENKFILVPAPNRRFDTLEQVVEFYLDLNRDIGLLPLKNPLYRSPTLQQNSGNIPSAMTHNPTPQEVENEYVRLGKFAAAKQDQQAQEAEGGKAPIKPVRPSMSRGPASSEYMNVTPAQLPQEIISGTSNGRDGNYIYAAVGTPKPPPANGATSKPIVPQDSIVIRGAERTTPVVARFGDMGAPVQFSRNGSSSMFEELPPASPNDSSCYVNFELNNQVVNNLNISEDRPKSSGMSKSSAKAGKNKMAKTAAKTAGQPQYYQNQYPPAATGPIGYIDPVSMATPPGKNTRPKEEEMYPAATGPIGYTDPSLSMGQPPPKNNKSPRQQLEEQFPAGAPGVMGYTDPALSMGQPPPRMRSTARHNGNV